MNRLYIQVRMNFLRRGQARETSEKASPFENDTEPEGIPSGGKTRAHPN